MDKVQKALEFAKKAHSGQKRKYTGEDYITHCVEVMEIVKSVEHNEDMLCAALLHDVVEDTDVALVEIDVEFGKTVGYHVNRLTDVSIYSKDLNRKERKALDRAWLSKAWDSTKTIKLADMISNSKSILQHDKKFAKVYLQEKYLLLQVLKEGDKVLWDQAYQIVMKGLDELSINVEDIK